MFQKLQPGAWSNNPLAIHRHRKQTRRDETKRRGNTCMVQWEENELPPAQLLAVCPRRPSNMRVIPWLFAVVTHAWMVTANVEKTIFLGPRSLALPNDHPSLEDLRLDTLSPTHKSILEAQLPVQFPTAAAPRGLESWYILRDLKEGRRYEVRICWPATVCSSGSSGS